MERSVLLHIRSKSPDPIEVGLSCDRPRAFLRVRLPACGDAKTAFEIRV